MMSNSSISCEIIFAPASPNFKVVNYRARIVSQHAAFTAHSDPFPIPLPSALIFVGRGLTHLDICFRSGRYFASAALITKELHARRLVCLYSVEAWGESALPGANERNHGAEALLSSKSAASRHSIACRSCAAPGGGERAIGTGAGCRVCLIVYIDPSRTWSTSTSQCV